MAANVGQISSARSTTAWDHAQGWQSARRAMAGHFLREGEAARESFGAAWSSKIDDTVDFAFQVAVNRINAAAKAKALATVASVTGKIWTPPTTVYAGASIIDLVNNTITLGDGTKINTRTGSKVDVSV
jgi:hypothetical protein